MADQSSGRRELSAQLDDLGPAFSVELLGPQEFPDASDTGWRPLVELVDGSGALGQRVRAVRHALSQSAANSDETIKERVAVSTAQFGLVGRILAPMMAAHVLGWRLGTAADTFWWQSRLGSPVPLAARVFALDVQGPLTLAGTAVEAMTVAFRDSFAVSPRTLWGNVGAAANSTANLLARVRPDLGPLARAAADQLLADPRIDGGTLHSGAAFRRHSCCLIYLASGNRADVCGDCVLETHGTRSET